MIKYRIERGSSYSLCSTKVFATINNKEYEISLHSGGYVSWGDEDIVEEGPWDIYIPAEIKEYEETIKRWVNENIEWGCCGGCI